MPQGKEGYDESATQVIGDGESQGQGPVRRNRTWIALLLLASVTGLIAIFTLVGGQRASTPTTVSPRLLSDPAPITVDARTPGEKARSSRWAHADLESDLEFMYVRAANSHFIAVGHDEEGLGMWRSDTGEHWVLTDRLKLPESVDAPEIPRSWSPATLKATEWNGRTFVYAWLGEGVTAVWSDAEFVGFASTRGRPTMITRVTGDRLLAGFLEPDDTGAQVRSGPRDTFWMTSGNGVDWERVSPIGLGDDHSDPITWIDGYFYAGAWCPSATCEYMLYRSVDAVDWSRVDLELPESNDAVTHISDIADVGDDLLAIGTGSMDMDDQASAWLSTTGARWSLFPLGDAFAPSHVDLALESIEATQATALISVDGASFDLTKGSIIETDAGRVELTEIGRGEIALGLPRKGILQIGQTIRLTSPALLHDIETAGDHVAVEGILSSYDSIPAVWISEDRGVSWNRTIIDGHNVAIDAMAVTEDHVVLVGNENGGYQVWYYTEPPASP